MRNGLEALKKINWRCYCYKIIFNVPQDWKLQALYLSLRFGSWLDYEFRPGYSLQVGQNELLQYHCYNVLMKILNIHPPVSPAVNDLYLALYGDSEETKRGTVIG